MKIYSGLFVLLLHHNKHPGNSLLCRGVAWDFKRVRTREINRAPKAFPNTYGALKVCRPRKFWKLGSPKCLIRSWTQNRIPGGRRHRHLKYICVIVYVKPPKIKVAHLSSYYAVEKMQGKVSTLKMSFTSNRNSLKDPANFSSTHLRNGVYNASPLLWLPVIWSYIQFTVRVDASNIDKGNSIQHTPTNNGWCCPVIIKEAICFWILSSIISPLHAILVRQVHLSLYYHFIKQ